MIDKDVQVILVNYNTKEMTTRCLHSLFEQTNPDLIETTLVDNASEDGSVAEFETKFPELRITKSATNLGFAAANNLAANQGTTTYIFLLNTDTIVLDRAVERVLEFANKHPDAGIWGMRTVFEDGSLNPFSCFGDMSAWSLFCSLSGLSRAFDKSPVFNPEEYAGWQRDSDRDVDNVSGCAFLIRRDLWQALGGFDEAFFMYGEEADLCHRARKMGYQPKITASAEVVHLMGKSYKMRSNMWEHMLRAKRTLIERQMTGIERRLAQLFLFLTPLSRQNSYRIATLLGKRGAKEQAQTWTAVWSNRKTWQDGY